MTKMRRRGVLQAGAALATLPLAGCAQAPAEPKTPTANPPRDGAPAAVDRGGPPPPAATPEASAPAPAQRPEQPGSSTLEPSPAPSSDEPPKTPLARVIARVGKNHGHVFVVALVDVYAGAEKTYDLAGAASHPHSVTLSGGEMRALRNGEIVRVRSTENSNHGHRLWVRCAPATDPPEWVSACKATFTGKDEHEVVLPAADLASTADRTYDVQGIAGHNHQLTLSAADFETLRKGGPVTRHTTRLADDSHMHQVTIELIARKG